MEIEGSGNFLTEPNEKEDRMVTSSYPRPWESGTERSIFVNTKCRCTEECTWPPRSVPTFFGWLCENGATAVIPSLLWERLRESAESTCYVLHTVLFIRGTLKFRRLLILNVLAPLFFPIPQPRSYYSCILYHYFYMRLQNSLMVRMFCFPPSMSSFWFFSKIQTQAMSSYLRGSRASFSARITKGRKATRRRTQPLSEERENVRDTPVFNQI